MSLSLFGPRMVLCWCLAAASPMMVFGGVNPTGGEYPIAGSLPGDQTSPDAALNISGGYLVWQDNSVSPNGPRIRALNLSGPFATPFVVSSAAFSKDTGSQEKPRVALLLNGGAVIVWQGGKPGARQIFARFIGADGGFIKNDIRVSSHSKNEQIHQAVAVLTDGSVVIVWSSSGLDGSLQGVFAQRFTSEGGKLGSEFQVNQEWRNNQRTPSVAALANGGFVIAWVSELQRSASSVDIYARLFNGSGTPFAAEFPVNTTTSNLCADPEIAGSPAGGFAVAWSQKTDVTLVAGSADGVLVPAGVPRSTTSWDVCSRMFNAGGAPVSDVSFLNTERFGDQYGPRIAASANGYLAVWTSLGQDGSWEGVYGQALTGSGAPDGGEFRVNTGTISRQIHPTLAFGGNSQFLVVWSSFLLSGNFDLLAQKYSTAP